MKNFQALLATVLGGLVLSVAVSVSAQATDTGFVTVVRVDGIASYSLGDDKWQPLEAGKILPVGSSIRTDYNGVVDVVLGKDINLPHTAVQGQWNPSNPAPHPGSKVMGMSSYQPAVEQNVVRLTPDTTLSVDKLKVIDTGADTVSDTELDLKKGKIFASVKKLNGASQYLIKLPNGIAGVRGTQFSISVDGTTAVFESTGGGVVLSLVLPDGTAKTFIVSPDNLFNPTTGQISPLNTDAVSFLKSLFHALVTTYSPVALPVAYNHGNDNTQIYISPCHGGSGKGGKKGGGGQGGGQPF